MRARAASPYLAIALTWLLAVLLSIYPVPPWLMPARPDWMALFAIYWITRAPAHFGMGLAWLAGLLLDGMSGGLLGPRALELAVVAYAALVLRQRMLHYTLAQQVALVWALCAAGQLLYSWAQGLGGHGTPSLWSLMGSLTSAFCWPILAISSSHRRIVGGWDEAA